MTGDGQEEDAEAASYMDSFAQHQTGNVGDITAGLPPQDYVDYPYIEWYGDGNGRVVIELAPKQIAVIGNLLPWTQQEPASRKQQAQNMGKFLGEIARSLTLPHERAICPSVTHAQQQTNSTGKE